jgi:hypothetical protein
MNIKTILLCTGLWFSITPHAVTAQVPTLSATHDSMLRMDMYELERRLQKAQFDTIPLPIVLQRLRDGKGVSPGTLIMALGRSFLPKDSVRAFVDSLINIEIVEKGLLIPILTDLLPYIRQSQDSVLRKKVMRKVYEARRHVYRQYLDLQYLNYEVAKYLYAQKDYEKGDSFLWDVSDMRYVDAGVDDSMETVFEISAPLYKLQEEVYLKLAEEVIRRKKKSSISILLRHPDYDYFRREASVRLKLNKLLKEAGMEPLKEK